MSKAKMIVLWGSEDLLTFSIEALLAAKQDWKVISISNNEDLEALIRDVENHPSDLVIIHQRPHNPLTMLPLQLLQDHPAIKVITVSLENNAMDVYRRQKIIVKQTSDLIAAIENET